MTSKEVLMGTGLSPFTANEFGDSPGIFVAAGTTQAGATLVTQKLVIMTATGADGVRLPQATPGQMFLIYNQSASAGIVYAPASTSLITNTLNGTASTTGLTLQPKKAAIVMQGNLGNWFSILTA